MKEPLTVILSAAKDLGSCFCSSYLPRTAEMLRFAQHDRIEFFHEYHDAVNDLRNARKHLEKALNDGCGRRDRAMRAIDAAIHECDEAVAAMH